MVVAILTREMLGSIVGPLFHTPVTLRVQSDFKEGTILLDVWKSAMTMSGGQCAMIHGDKLMLKLPVDSLDFQV